MPADSLKLTAIRHLPEIHEGDDLCDLLVKAMELSSITPQSGDVLVVAQKIVSKAEGQFVVLDSITPKERANQLADITGKAPQLVECVLRESTEVLRAAPGRLIVRHRTGHVLANAGIDRSNVPMGPDGERVLLLPEDPDASAERLRQALVESLDVAIGVIISDSFGRPWRRGVVNVAIAVSGCAGVIDLRSRPDRDGRRLESTESGFADAVSAAAGLLMGQSDESVPAVLVHGLEQPKAAAGSQSLLRAIEEDLFR